METCALFNCYSDIFSHLHEFSIEFNCLLYNHIQKVPFQSDQMCAYLPKTFLLVKTKAKIQIDTLLGKNFQSLFDQNIWILIDSRHDMYTFVKIIEGIQFRKEKQRTIMITWRGRPYFWLWKNKKLQNEKTYFLSSNNKMQECDTTLVQNYELSFENLTHHSVEK